MKKLSDLEISRLPTVKELSNLENFDPAILSISEYSDASADSSFNKKLLDPI